MTFLPHTAIPEDLVEGLNPPQRAAVEYRGDALLIIAGAGSGKTRVLTHRIASLIATREAWPSQILAITFTNKAAAEMRERVGHLLGEAVEGMWISTFHSACVRILRREAEKFGYTQGFTIYDSADSKALLKRIVKALEAESMGVTVSNAQNKISTLKNELVDPDGYARQIDGSNPRDQLILEIYRQYQRQLERNKAFDFDDLISQTVWLFRAYPEIAALYQRRFRHVLVDEYQDTNHAQYALIRELTRRAEPQHVPADTRIALDADGSIPPASLTVVGDSDQSIYAFRGADIRNITEFERDFPGAETILLEQNYRSTQHILDAANAVIGNNFDRRPKNLWTAAGEGSKIIGYTGYSAHDEAQFVADEIHKLHDSGTNFNDVAVFYRTNAQTRTLEEILIRAAVPYRLIGGTKFYERAEVKDIVAYLMCIANPADELSVRRIINSPKRAIGPATETAISNFAGDQDITFREAMARAEELGLGPKVTNSILELEGALQEAEQSIDPNRPAGPVTVAAMLETLIERTEYTEKLRATKNPQDDARAENVEELVNVAKEFDKQNPDGTLVDFLTEVALVAAADELDDESGAVSLMTLHTAKGLEYDAVFITGVEEELLPHRMSADEPGGLAEERRLFYVGITRARKVLHISLAMSRTTFGESSVAMPSRFLQEIPEQLIEWRQSPGMATSRGGERPRALNATGFGGGRRAVGSRMYGDMPEGRGLTSEFKPTRGNRTFDNQVTGQMRDNADLELEQGDRVKHTDFGEGTVRSVRGLRAKRVAEVEFDEAGTKKLLIKVAPLEKLS
ncbi:ATP-dependent helicase [Gulosibacter sp. 10]|uniref:ATP-dependent helicase n=1 Tax=Gulosibacter sp. 10 TaxID=1255570 RepID=UPI00097ECD6E|nr:UvrD-helicase domain-containing protein [Gulosibacter sp. 10]SJM71498.1 ATP-dependent DNA helicase UvrD/PcrA [Gulosibacter sp. 10]